MLRREVVLAPEARDDLAHIYHWIAERSSSGVADAYLARLETYVLGFDLASERGSLHDDIRLGLRVVGFEKRINIAFHVNENEVVILRFFYAGQDWISTLFPS